MVPDSCEPLTILRVVEPSDAVIATEVALNACQVSVTLCPLVIEPVFAENVIVGLVFGLDVPTHEERPKIPHITAPHEIQRTAL